MDVDQIRTDLLAEQAALDSLVAAVAPEAWSSATASPGWTVADQIGHLAFFDRAAAQAIADPSGFEVFRDEFLHLAAQGPVALDDHALARYRALDPAGLLAAWRADRAALADAADGLDEGDRIEWFGPSMSARSFLTARLMEVWAHGQDIVDALDLERPATDRLASVARLGFITRAWSFLNRGDEPDDVPVRVTLAAPSGATWDFGDESATERVEGPAEDFCLVVTQRRHIDDTDLVVNGDAARRWMLVAQAFAGGATDGPAAVQS